MGKGSSSKYGMQLGRSYCLIVSPLRYSYQISGSKYNISIAGALDSKIIFDILMADGLTIQPPTGPPVCLCK